VRIDDRCFLSEADMVDHHIENLKSLSPHPINPIIATGHHEDEISMVDAKLLDLLEGLACNLRGNRQAFGGMQAGPRMAPQGASSVHWGKLTTKDPSTVGKCWELLS